MKNKYYVIHGEHKDPNDINTIKIETTTTCGPFETAEEAAEANTTALHKNVDNYYHNSHIVSYDILERIILKDD